LFWQFIAYAIAQLLKQFYCARKLRNKLPQFIAVCVIGLTVGRSDSVYTVSACAISAYTFNAIQQINYTLQACICRTKRAWAVREIAN